MKAKRGLAFAITGASVGLFGVSVTVGGLAYQLSGPNLGPAVVFGPLIAAGGMLLSLMAAITLEEMKPRMRNSSALRRGTAPSPPRGPPRPRTRRTVEGGRP